MRASLQVTALLLACEVPTPQLNPAPPAPQLAPTPKPASRSWIAPQSFHLVAVDAELELFRLGDELLVRGWSTVYRVGVDGRLVELDLERPDEVAAHDRYEPRGPLQDLDLAGRWPDALWANPRSVSKYHDGTVDATFQRKGGAWIAHTTRQDDAQVWHYPTILDWQKGQVLGLRARGPRARPRDYIRSDQYRTEDLTTGAQFDVLADAITPAWPRIDPTLAPDLAVAAPDGALFAVGYKQPDEPHVQRWDPRTGDRDGVVDKLPGKAIIVTLVAGSAGLAYAGGHHGETPYLARFDGTTWSQEPVPQTTRILDLALAPDGELWAVTQREKYFNAWLYRRRRPGEWTAVDLPSIDPLLGRPWAYVTDAPPRRQPARWGLPSPEQVFIRSDGDMWFTGTVHGWYVLLRGVPVPEPPRHLSRTNSWVGPLAPWRPGLQCNNGFDPFVHLLDMPPGIADDAPVPAVEALVRDAPAVLSSIRDIYEFEEHDRRFVGLLVKKTVSRSKLDKLLAALEHVAPGEPHQPLCHTPQILRAFDRKTGKPDDSHLVPIP